MLSRDIKCIDCGVKAVACAVQGCQQQPKHGVPDQWLGGWQVDIKVWLCSEHYYEWGEWNK